MEGIHHTSAKNSVTVYEGSGHERGNMTVARREVSRMKIGMVSPYDWSYPGGVRAHVRHLADAFVAMGHDVRILTPAS